MSLSPSLFIFLSISIFLVVNEIGIFQYLITGQGSGSIEKVTESLDAFTDQLSFTEMIDNIKLMSSLR